MAARRSAGNRGVPRAAARKNTVSPSATPVSTQAAAPAASTVTVAKAAGTLGTQLTIHQVRAAHQQLLDAAGAGSASIDVSDLQSVDTAGLQLLLAASRGGIGDLGILLSGGGNAALRDAQQSLGLKLTFAGDGG